MNHTLSLKEFVKPGPNIFRDVGLPEKQNQNWFRPMKSVHSNLDDMHINCFTGLLKRKIEASPELFKTRIGILPTYFFAQCKVIWKRDYVNTKKTFVEDEWICTDDLTCFVLEGQLTWCKAWWDYDILLIPCSVCSSHWVLCELNLYTYKIEIYDSLLEGNVKNKQLQWIPYIKSLISFLPGILHAGGYYERHISNPKSVEVNAVKPYLIPQQHDT
ncbi:hypothetical protein Ddye_030288 [Dipteronia dyeriana]|uniref:Ubiquitin-like protease family profile domain-containing protein n=1 Tax=Dipteronia dyeriana TaxID=168575 RepID=A0AAD9TGT9_9ROSI|nr:hypothetical protein Ddye_030288 [Dipteronia dyeriana]